MKNSILLILVSFFYINISSSQGFVDVTASSGVDVFHDGETIYEPITPMGSGACWFDYNKDGYLDLYVTMRSEANKLFENQGDGTFVEVAALLGIDDPTGEGAGVSVADIDNDGWEDLFLANGRTKKLYKNNFGSSFTDITLSAFGSYYPTGESRGVTGSWGDYDDDGYLDLYIAQHEQPNNYPPSATERDYLFYNNGGNSFTDVSTTSLRLDTIDGWAFIGGWFDYDRDNDLDILMVTDCDVDVIQSAFNTKLFRNDGGSNPIDWNFTEVSIATGLDDCRNGMGLSIGDVDRDGWMDAFYTNIGQIVLWKNDMGSFSNATVSAGMDNYPSDEMMFSWGSCMIDYDLDMDLDIGVAFGHLNLSGITYPHPNLFFENDGTGNFVEIGDQVNMNSPARTRELVYADYDNDGDVDIFEVNYNEQCRLLRNDQNTNNNWFKVQTQGTISNWNGIGAYIKITTPDGVEQFHEVRSGSNKSAGDSQYAVFGLGQNATITSIEISWPSGLVDSYNNLAANQFVTVIEDTPLVDNDNDGWVEANDCDDNNDQAYPGAIEICDGIDNDCDDLVDAADPSVQGMIYYADNDLDTYGDVNNASCSFVSGYVLNGDDCDDTDPTVYLGAPEICDGIDSDCDGFIDNGCLVPHSSVAREWNEQLLHSIRKDLARPTVHARNLWHSSVAMYDLWAIDDTISRPYFLGETREGFEFEFNGIIKPANIDSARNIAISYCMYRLLRHRFQNNANLIELYNSYDNLMLGLGYDLNFSSTDYSLGSYAALGNYFAQEIIDFGLQDNSNEQNDYDNEYYNHVNDSLVMTLPGNPNISDYNRWQPLSLDTFIDQSGNIGSTPSPPFLSPEWGAVHAFALKDEDKSTYNRDGFDYEVYHDPTPPPYHDINGGANTLDYEWGFSLVSTWSSHLDSNDPTMWDISPGNIGNIQSYPNSWSEYPSFYDKINGGDASIGHSMNPSTGMAYDQQLVPRADYARVLAEFWADGPDSETPPGHWFTILNYVNDHPELVKKFEGNGPILNDLEWDVKTYFTLAGALHDSAVAAWGIKGWYDYIRPVSAIRALADLGQSSNNALPNYHPAGIKLIPGYIELVYAGDPLEGMMGENIGKIKLYAWRGPDYIVDPNTSEAGVGWILAENWWPYQRPTFVTPPFAGYVSGHSTFSRAAAIAMGSMTGDPFFPGGMGEFFAPKDEFLVFEDGPSVDVTLQWATYIDASDQCSLSRIWGGIHPPVDDIPGRLIGESIGNDAFALAREYILGIKCHNVFSLEIDPINKTLYQGKQLTVSGIARNNNNPHEITFLGSIDILLDPGFEVEAGTSLKAEIGPCID